MLCIGKTFARLVTKLYGCNKFVICIEHSWENVLAAVTHGTDCNE